MTKKEIQKQIQYWIDLADHDLGTIQTLWRGKRYDACLFFCHLIIEKCLKAKVVQQTRQAAPKTHDLLRLAVLANIELNADQEKILAEMNFFNIEGRYAADKYQLYKIADQKYSKKYYDFTREFSRWLTKDLR